MHPARLRELYMGDCCQRLTHTAPLAPLPLSKLKLFFIHTLDLQNAKFKDGYSNFIYLEQSTPKFSLIILYLSIEVGDLSTEHQKWKVLRPPQPQSLHSAAERVCALGSPLI